MNTSISMIYVVEMRHPHSTICGNDLLTFYRIISFVPHSSRPCSCSLKKSWGEGWVSCGGLRWGWHGQRDRGNRWAVEPAAKHPSANLLPLCALSHCIWLQVICPQQSDMYIYREQLVGAICSTFSLPFHDWKFFWFFPVNWKLLQLYYVQRKHGLESHLQFCPQVNLEILQIQVLRHA